MNNSSTNLKDKAFQIRVSNHYVGEVRDGIFKKRIKFSKHSLHTPPALALSVESLRIAEKFGARKIEITDIESGRVYHCALEHFKRYSWELQRGGFELQRALPIERWDITGGPTVKPKINNQVRPVLERVINRPIQLALL
jgi:dissimilatory sulfite reductase (desulfoviridin) alpha/beta subunit